MGRVVVRDGSLLGDYTESTAYAAAVDLIRGRRSPSAVFAANDASALGVLAAARSADLAVPESLSVIGFDNTTIAQSDFVGLSTIDYPRQEMGRLTLALLKERMADRGRAQRQMTLMPNLVARITTASRADK